MPDARVEEKERRHTFGVVWEGILKNNKKSSWVMRKEKEIQLSGNT